jgi:hypothetical protein
MQKIIILVLLCFTVICIIIFGIILTCNDTYAADKQTQNAINWQIKQTEVPHPLKVCTYIHDDVLKTKVHRAIYGVGLQYPRKLLIWLSESPILLGVL